MSKELNDAIERLERYRKEFQAAQSAYLSELERDCERSEGSYNQELRREAHQESLAKDFYNAKAALEAQEKIVEQLRSQLA